MTAKLGKLTTEAEKRWIPVDIEGLGDFSIQVRKPTYAERLADHGFSLAGWMGDAPEHLRGGAVHRISTTICGWKDLLREPDAIDETKPVEEQLVPVSFSQEMLATLCEHFPELVRTVIRIANEQYHGLDQESAKNSDKESPSP